ncbi:MAG: hypothetical protein ABSF97_19070 [Candidatus Sulfotelmatobacter sp.]|jgi:hypothetical protein
MKITAQGSYLYIFVLVLLLSACHAIAEERDCKQNRVDGTTPAPTTSFHFSIDASRQMSLQ